jgi:hypothetical protein
MLESPMYPLCRKVRGGDNQQETYLFHLMNPSEQLRTNEPRQDEAPVGVDPFRQAETQALPANLWQLDQGLTRYRVGALAHTEGFQEPM